MLAYNYKYSRYMDDDTQLAWEAWQAALQSGEQVTLERVEVYLDIFGDEQDDVRIVIEPDPEGSLVYYDNVVRVMQATPQPVVDQRYMNPRLWTKEMSDAWHSNIPDLQKAFDALLSAGKEAV
jgi:hypothetical protein